MGFNLKDYANSKSNNRQNNETPSASAGGFSLIDYANRRKREEEQNTTPAADPRTKAKGLYDGVSFAQNQYTYTPAYTDTGSSNYSREDVLRILADNKIAQEQERERAKAYNDTSAKLENALTPPKAPIGTPTVGMENIIKNAEDLGTERMKKARGDLGYRDESGVYRAGSADADYAKISKATGISEDELRKYADTNTTGAQRQAYTALVTNGDMSLDEFKNVSRQYGVSDEDAEGLYAYSGIEGLRGKIRELADSPYKAQSQYEIARYVESQLKDRGYDAYGYKTGKYIMPAEYAEVILRETNAPEGGYTAENLADYPARALALCAVDVTKNSEWEKEADQIYDILYNNLFSKKDEWKTGGDIWTTVANNIRETARPTAVGIMLGLAKGLGAESIGKMVSDDYNDKFDASYARVSQLAPTATGIANTAGTIGLYAGLAYITGGVASSIVGAGASAIGASTASAGVKLATGALSGAMTFGSVTALQNAGDYYRGNIDLAEYGKRVGQSEIVGAATSLASGLVRIKFDEALSGRLQRAIYSKAGENFTTKIPSDAYDVMFGGDRMPLVGSVKNPQTVFYYFTRNMASGLAGSGAFIASNALVTGEAPTQEQIAYQFAFGFVSSLVHSFIEAHSVSAAQAKYAQYIEERIGRIDSEMQKFYQYAENATAGRPVSSDGAVSAGGDLGVPNASDLIVEIEALRRYLVASLDTTSPNAVSELAVVDYYLAGLQETLAKYVVNPTTGAPMGDYTATPETLGAAPIGIEAAGNYVATEELSGAITSALDAGITEGAMSPADVVRAEAEATPLIAPVGETLAPTPTPASTEQTLTQLAEEAVAPTEPQVAPTATEAVVAPIETEQTTRITPETENAKNEEITAPAATEEKAVESEKKQAWTAMSEKYGKNGSEIFNRLYDDDLTGADQDAINLDFAAYYNAGVEGKGLMDVQSIAKAEAFVVFDGDGEALANMEIAAYDAGLKDAALTSANKNDVKMDISRTADGKSYVIVDENGVDFNDGESVAKSIAKVLNGKYKNLILANGQFVRVNSQTNREFVASDYAKAIRRENADLYNDKLKTIANLDEILSTASNWINENLKHQRRDNITSFGRGRVLYKVGGRGYVADVLVGIKNDGSALLYDLVDIHEKEITDAFDGGREFYEIPSGAEASVTQDSIPDNSEKVNTVLKKSDNPANTAMTMAEARRMIETAYRVGEVKEWYADEGINQTVDEWLKNVDSDDIAMIIENDFDLQRKYISGNQDILDEKYQIADVIDAYKDGTLVGKEKKKAERLDVKQKTGLKDDRFYAPREVSDAKAQFEIAQQRITNANKQQVIQARADVVIFAHNRNAAELLGVSQAELNKKLRSWTRYSATAREISERINAGVPLENRWTGIENCAWVNQASISQKDVDMLVKSVTGDPNGAERKYIARTMLALDTHIDYKGLNFIFESKAELNKKHGLSGRTNGIYNGRDTIACKYLAPNTVAHEMGHYLDTRFGRDLVGAREDATVWLTSGVNKDIVRERYGEDGVKFVDNFNVFMDGLTDVNDTGSGYSNDRTEIFARFVARFVEWTENVAAGYRMSNYEYNSYNDRFTTAQYVEFARLLQEKALLDGMRAKEVRASVTQEISSAKTSIKQVPALFNNPNVEFGETNVDIGGGKYDLATQQLAEQGTTNYVFDPFNRSEASNKVTFDFIKESGGADTATCANVLNVIAEPEARANVILETAKAIKPDGTAYFMVYEGDGKGVGRETSAGWQNNRPTADYVSEIEQYFGDVTRKGKLIIATDPQVEGKQAYWQFSPDSDNGVRYSLSDVPASTADAYGELRKQLAEANSKIGPSARELLTSALDTVAESEAERKLLERYRSRIEKLDAIEAERNQLRSEIREISFGKGERDMAKLKALQTRVNYLEGQLNYWDKKLLKDIEANKPLQGIVERERAKAFSRGKDAEKLIRKERAAKTELRGDIKKIAADLTKRMNTPTDRRWVPANLMQGVIDVANLIDPTSGREGTKSAEKFASVKQGLLNIKSAYDALESAQDSDYKSEFDKEFSSMIGGLAEVIGDTPVRRMTLEQLQDVKAILSDIRNMISDATRQIGIEEAVTNYELGTRAMQEQSEVGRLGLTNGKVASWMREQLVNPMRAVNEMSGFEEDSVLNQQMRALNEGRIKAAEFVMREQKKIDALRRTKSDLKRFNDAVEKAYDFGLTDVNGNPLKISKMQAMQILLTYEREHTNANRRHLENNVEIPDPELLSKGKVRQALDKPQIMPALTPDALNKILVGLNTEWDKRFLDVAREIFRTDAANAINETTMITKRRPVATENAYIPYELDKNFIYKENENLTYNAALANAGFLKSMVPNANQPLIIRGLNYLLDKHIDDVGKIYGLSIPVRNFNKVLNVKESGGVNSVRKAVFDNWGSNGVHLIEQAIADVQSGRPSNDVLEALAGRIKNAMVVGSLVGNLSVVIKQAASYPTAGSILSTKALAKGLADYAKIKAQDAWDEIDEITPQHYLRRQGLSVQELGEFMQSRGWKNKVDAKLGRLSPSKWIQGVDVATTAALFYACKAELAAQGITEESENYKTELADLYNRVLEETQPMYDPLHRVEMSKSKFGSKIFVFQTQPMQNSGILREAALGLKAARKRYGKDSKQAKAAGKAFGKAVASQFASHLVFTAMTFIASALLHRVNRYRDDEEGKLTAESVLSTLGMDFAKNYFNALVPFFGSGATQFAENLINGTNYDVLSNATVDKITTTITAAGKMMTQPSWENAKKLGLDLATYFGIPGNNFKNLYEAVKYHTQDIINGEFGSFNAGYTPTSKQTYNRLYNAYTGKSGADYEKLYNDAVESLDVKDPAESIKNAMESRMKKEQGVSSVKELDSRYLAPDEQEDFDKTVNAVKATDAYKQASSDTKAALEDIAYAVLKREDEYADQKKYGLDDTGYIIYKMALDVVDQPNKNGNYGTYTNAEKDEAAAMVPDRYKQN